MNKKRTQLMLDILKKADINKYTKSEQKELKLLERQLERDLKPIKVRSAKNKGKNLQNKVCEKLSDVLDIPWSNSDDEALIQSRQMGHAGVDIILRGEARNRFPFSIECKSTETFNLMGTLNQAKSNIIENTDWLIIYKNKKLKSPIVIIDFDVFLQKVIDK